MDNKAVENIMTDFVTRTVKSATSFNTELFQAWVDMNTRMWEVMPVTNWLTATKNTKN